MISAESFWDAFSSKLFSACSDDQNWRQYFANPTQWTNFVMPTLTNSVGKELGFDPENEIQKEFYRIDVIYYKVYANRQADFTIPNEEWNWDLEVAIEHDNNSKHWPFNVAKLCHINCGLKVIIGYHEYGNQRKYGTIEQKLDYMKTSLYDLRKYKQVPEDNWLLILGPNDLARDFVAYKFDGEEFSNLEDKRILQQ